MNLNKLIDRTITNYVHAQSTRNQRPSDDVFYAYQAFIADIYHNALQDPYRDWEITEDFIIRLLMKWTGALPTYHPGPFRTPLKPHITGDLTFDTIMRATCSPPIQQHELLQGLRQQLNENTPRDKQGDLILPDKDCDPEVYFRLTPFMNLVKAQMSFSLTNYKQAHWVMFGKSGSGKTSLLGATVVQHLKEDPPAMLIIDPHNELADKLERLRWNPDKLLIVDPAEAPAINLFEGNIADFDYIFEAKEAGLTPLQAVGLNYLVAAIRERHKTIKSNIFDLLRMVDEDLGKKGAQSSEFWPFIEKLPDEAKQYFQHRFYKNDQTRAGISQRIHTIMEDQTFKEMFSARTNKLDLYDALHNKKQTVLVTANGLGKSSSTFIRYIIAQCMALAFRRPKNSHPILLFVDEAQLVLKGNQEAQRILTECRKFGLFLRIFTQQLSLLESAMDVILGQTDVKIVGVPFPEDASRLAKSMNCEPADLIRHKKDSGWDFSVTAEPGILKPITITLDNPVVEAQLTADEHRKMRAAICSRLKDTTPTPTHTEPMSPGPDPTAPVDWN